MPRVTAARTRRRARGGAERAEDGGASAVGGAGGEANERAGAGAARSRAHRGVWAAARMGKRGLIAWTRALDPIASNHGRGALELESGPYDRRREATDALAEFERAQGRGIVTDQKKSCGNLSAFVCSSHAVVRGESGAGASASTCGFSAHFSKWRGKKGDRRWYLTKYVPHDEATCPARPRLTVDIILRDERVRDVIRESDGHVHWRVIADLVRERYGVDIPERTASRVRHTALLKA